jgi:predicted RNA methylase
MARFAALRESLTQRLPVCDGAFDVVYPCWAQEASARFWTPVRVALDAAELLKEAGAKAVLDVGSGVGKFAVVARLASGLDITGVEQRPYLVTAARNAAERYRAPVKFICDRIEHIDPHVYDAFYFFNPFGENLVRHDERLDEAVTLNRQRFAQDVRLVERWLEEAAVGTSIVTYNGFGGRIPSSYELVLVQPAGRHRVRLWTKRSLRGDSSYFIESSDKVTALRGLPARRSNLAGD